MSVTTWRPTVTGRLTYDAPEPRSESHSQMPCSCLVAPMSTLSRMSERTRGQGRLAARRQQQFAPKVSIAGITGRACRVLSDDRRADSSRSHSYRDSNQNFEGQTWAQQRTKPG